MDKDIEHLLKSAGQFDVHRWSEHPEINGAIDPLLQEIVHLRRSKGKRIRELDKVWRHLKVIVLDLYVATEAGLSPYRAIARAKSDYQKESRYRKIHLKYDYTIGVLNDLIELGFVEQHAGFLDRKTGKSSRSRICATVKLLSAIESANGMLNLIQNVGTAAMSVSQGEEEMVVLHGADRQPLDYEDTDETRRMRENLKRINAKIEATKIVLNISDEQFKELKKLYKDKKGKQLPISINFTSKTIHRVFNGTFESGGRFYGGWWQNVPKKFRPYIEINNKPTVELDYSSHHPRMLYAMEHLDAPEDLYAVENCPFSRQDLKNGFMAIVNAKDKVSATRALRFVFKIKQASTLVEIIQTHFAPIAHHFFTGVGLKLQYYDSQIAEGVMLRMLDLGATVLPLHDSFIVRNSYEDELREVMTEEFERMFDTPTRLKRKETVLEIASEARCLENNQPVFVTSDLETLFEDMYLKKTWNVKVFGT